MEQNNGNKIGTRTQKAQEEDDSVASFQVEPISVEIGYGLIPIVDSSVDNSLMNRIVAIRKQSARELGILVSPVRIRDNLYLDANDYVIKIRGNEVGRGDIYPNKVMVISPNEEPFPFKESQQKNQPFIWMQCGSMNPIRRWRICKGLRLSSL